MEEVPLIKALHAKYSTDAAIVGVSVDINVSRADQTVKEKQMTWRILGRQRLRRNLKFQLLPVANDEWRRVSVRAYPNRSTPGR